MRATQTMPTMLIGQIRCPAVMNNDTVISGNNVNVCYRFFTSPSVQPFQSDISRRIYPSYLKMQESASWEVTIFKAWSWRFSHSKSMLHNAEDGCLSACPTGGSLESQLCVTTFEKGITIIFMLCLVLASERASESASSSSLGIRCRQAPSMTPLAIG